MRIRKVVKKILIEIDKFSPMPIFYPIIMTQKEKELFDKCVKDSRFYLEFGMGGTTIRVLQKSNAKIYSIDSSIEWINRMKKYLLVKIMMKKRLTLFYVDIGETGKWGYPVGDNFKELFPDYSAKIFRMVNTNEIDTVLVDGRFRVACVLKTILECGKNENLKILIHDFSIREQYEIVNKYLTKVDCEDTLFLFKIKLDIDLESLKNDYNIYKYIPD